MKWPLLLLLVSCLESNAATFLLDGVGLGAGKFAGEPGVVLLTDERNFTVNINDRTGLVAGLPIQVTINPGSLFGTYGVKYESTFTFRDTFTATALLGTVTTTANAIFVDTPPPLPPPGNWEGVLSLNFPSLQLTVPWDTDLSALSLRFAQSATVDGAGNLVIHGGGFVNNGATIVTQSVPEPYGLALAGGVLAVSAGSEEVARPGG